MEKFELASRFNNPKEEFVQKTIAQIEKNAQKFIAVPHFSCPTNEVYKATIAWICTIIQLFLQKDNSLLINYLYQVDLAEKTLNTLVHSGINSKVEQLAQLILEREAQKVYLRQKFQ